MKNFFTLMFMVFSLSAPASIEYVPKEQALRPTATEIATNRSCFSELEVLGCGNPGDDIEHFRACLHESYDKLNDSCKKIMTDLYQAK